MVTPELREQVQRTDDPAGFLVLLRLSHPGMDTAYVVNDTRDWTIGSTTYVGLPFRFTLPAATGGQAPRARLEIDNVGRALVPELEALPLGALLQSRISVVSRARPTVEEYVFEAPMSNVRVTTATISATVGNDDAWRAPAVKMRYDPDNSPGLFAG